MIALVGRSLAVWLVVSMSRPLWSAGMFALLATLTGIGASRPPGVDWIEPRTGMAFVHVPAGHFVMGSPASEPYRESQEIPHTVTISTAFHLGQYEVTARQWRVVMATTPGQFSGDDKPVENVNWFEAQDFLKRLSDSSADSLFRLPTEAEWEYACRAGTTTAYAVGASLSDAHARIDPRRPGDTGRDAAAGGPMPVGSFRPNAWGLFDMHGNVWEWTADADCPYAAEAATDPRAACRTSRKVIRGGSWYFRADSARCATRYTHQPQDRGFSLGFCVVRETRPRRR